MTVVLGGGLSGLSASYYLLRQLGQPSTIYEASNRVGGWIRTERHKDKGFVFETGPRTIRPKGYAGANTLQMIEHLQLPLDAIPSNHPAARNRLIFAKGELCPLPNSVGGVLRTLPPFTKPLVNAIFTDLRAESKKIKYGDESIYDFTARRFGSEVADYAISPLICGICAGDAKEISVRFLMNDLFEKEQKYGGVTKGIFLSKVSSSSGDASKAPGLFDDATSALCHKAQREKWSMYRVQNGLEWLPRMLAGHLRDHGADVRLNSDCRRITFTKDGAELDIKGSELTTKHIISALPSHKLAGCLKHQHPSLTDMLLSIPYVNVAVVNLQYSTEDLLKLDAFGFLVPPIERLPILGVIFDSCCFDMNGNTVLTVMMGGKWFDEYFGQSPTQKDLLDTALEQLRHILKIQAEPRLARVNILEKCIPQYTVGHQRRVSDIRRYIERYHLPLSLCGAAYDGVGINDVILSARRQVEGIFRPPNK